MIEFSRGNKAINAVNCGLSGEEIASIVETMQDSMLIKGAIIKRQFGGDLLIFHTQNISLTQLGHKYIENYSEFVREYPGNEDFNNWITE